MENEIKNIENQIKKINEIENDVWFVWDLEFVVKKTIIIVKVLQPRNNPGSFFHCLYAVKTSY